MGVISGIEQGETVGQNNVRASSRARVCVNDKIRVLWFLPGKQTMTPMWRVLWRRWTVTFGLVMRMITS